MITKLLFWLLLTTLSQSLADVMILNKQILADSSTDVIFSNGVLRSQYDDTIFNQLLNCQNGYLNIIDKNYSNIVVGYLGISQLGDQNTEVELSPNAEPRPYISQFGNRYFIVDFNCPLEVNTGTYYNKVTITLDKLYRFSFLVNCDPGKRHKQFQIGYLILAAIDAVILLSMAFHSQIWSLRYNGKRLSITISWKQVLFILLLISAVSAIIYLTAFKELEEAFVALTYFGIVTAIFFMFICFNQFFYYFNIFRMPIYRKLRICELLSILMTVATSTVAFLVDNWIYSNMMALGICVASIKLFHFASLKQAYISKTILVLIFSSISIIVHYLQPERSYNDYATELSSCLFLVVPDLVNNLYKKCSWLFIIDIIFPGVMLSYLRLYDLNRGSVYFGVYTLCGNITVVLATILWVVLEYAYPFSIPFSMVTYLSLMAVVFLVSWSRNQWKDLWSGMFEKQTSVVDSSKLTERDESFGDLVTKDMIEPLKRNTLVRQSQDTS